MISINGIELPNPTKFIIGMSDLDSSDTTRNEEGVLVRNRVRQGVTKIELSFKIRGRDVASIMGLIEPAQVRVSYMDPRIFDMREINAYVGDRTSNMLVYTPGMSYEDVLWEVSFNLIEY